MAEHVCPWWFCYAFDNPLRRLVQDPVATLKPFVAPGQTALDLGCGMGYFSLGLAHLVGQGGRVISVDLQDKMLAALKRRAAKQNLSQRIEPRRCRPDDLGIADLAGQVDFALAFWMLHEVPGRVGFVGQVAASLRPEGCFLVVEPRFHVRQADFAAELDLLRDQGWEVLERPQIWGSHAALLRPLRTAA
ncbi:MAG: class I SAM-dependent methyltransferase [Desulfarculus sp.]|nr:class I SAM-dependent methyltransferase [Desulfarculus sp.]